MVFNVYRTPADLYDMMVQVVYLTVAVNIKRDDLQRRHAKGYQTCQYMRIHIIQRLLMPSSKPSQEYF